MSKTLTMTAKTTLVNKFRPHDGASSTTKVTPPPPWDQQLTHQLSLPSAVAEGVVVEKWNRIGGSSRDVVLGGGE